MAGRRKRFDKVKIVAAWNIGLSVSAIAERFGAAPNTVESILRAAGIDRSGTRRMRFDGEAGYASTRTAR